MAMTLRDLEEAKKQWEDSLQAKSEEMWENFINIETCYGDIFIKSNKDNKPKTDEERELLKQLLEEIYYREDKSEILGKLGYEIIVVLVNDSVELKKSSYAYEKCR